MTQRILRLISGALVMLLGGMAWLMWQHNQLVTELALIKATQMMQQGQSHLIQLSLTQIEARPLPQLAPTRECPIYTAAR